MSLVFQNTVADEAVVLFLKVVLEAARPESRRVTSPPLRVHCVLTTV
jgi:hypothetical protein